MSEFGLPGSYDYDGDCGVSPSATSTAEGSAHPGAIGPGIRETSFAGGGEKNILSSPPKQTSGFALPGVPD